MHTKENYLKQIESQLPKIDDHLSTLRFRLISTQNFDVVECDKKVQELQAKYTHLQTKIETLKSMEDEGWKTHRTRVESAMMDLKNSIEDVGSWVWVRTAQ
jgi:peptidoglycan hydrolase CwlO-like protein